MPYAFVQQKENSAAGTATTLASGNMASNPIAGNLNVVAVAYANASSRTITVADTLLNTYSEIGSGFYDAGNAIGIRFFYAKNLTGGGVNSVTATYQTTSTSRGIYVAEYSGLDTIAPYTTGEFAIQEQANPGTGANLITSGNTPALSAQPAMVWGFSYDLGTGTFVAGTGYTSRIVNAWNVALGLEGCAEDKRITATSAVAATFTDAASGGVDSYINFVVVFKEPTAGNVLMGQVCT